MTRRSGKRHKITPKMWIRCVCGQTLGHVNRPRYSTGRPADPLWQIGGLVISSSYNSHEGTKFEHDHYGKIHTHSFDCVYAVDRAPGVLTPPSLEEQQDFAEMWDLGESDPLDNDWEDAVASHPDLNRNPARYTEAGITKRPRDRKRSNRRCGREHDVTGRRILDRWNELASITDDTPHMEAMRLEKSAYVAAGKTWEMILVD